MKMRHLLIAIALIAFGVFFYENIMAYSSGITGRTQKPGATPGCTCHGSTQTTSVFVGITGPSSMRAGDTATFILKIKGGPLSAAGTNIASSAGSLILSTTETFLQRLPEGGDFELTHTSPKAPSPDTVKFTFRYIAPNTPNSSITIYANGNSVNLSGSTSGDNWNFATNKTISITATSIQNINEVANSYSLSQNFPNPFNPTTNIKYGLTKSGFVTLKVYDLVGKEVATLVNQNQNAGTYIVDFKANDYALTSGIYFYKISSGDFSEVRKMILTK
jgi:hypothetical protein